MLYNVRNIHTCRERAADRKSLRCKAVLNRQLVASGTYVPNLRPHNVAMMLKSRFRSPKVVCYVSPDVPEWVLFDDFLVDTAMENAVSNAFTHGEPSCMIQAPSAFMTDSLHLVPRKAGHGYCSDKCFD